MEEQIARYAPIVRWLPAYDWRSSLRFDIFAGLAVWAVLMPQAIAYASLAGAPPQAGFYAAGAAVLLYALFGTCRALSVGPSSTPAMTAASIVGAATVSPGTGARLLAALALGVRDRHARRGRHAPRLHRRLRLTPRARRLRLGDRDRRDRHASSRSCSGVPGGNGNTFDKAWTILRPVDRHAMAAGRDRARRARGDRRSSSGSPGVPPAALLVVAASIAVSRALDLESEGVAVVSRTCPSSLPVPRLPHVGLDEHRARDRRRARARADLVRRVDRCRPSTLAARRGYEVDPNQELIALGAGNVLAGFLQGFPTDASLSRSSVADGQGVRSQLNGLVVFVLLLATILWLTPLFDGLPQATLAAVIIGSIYRLIDVRGLRHLCRIDPRGDFALALIALLGVLMFGPLGGIATAVTASLLALIAKLYRPNVLRPRAGARGTAGRGHPVPQHRSGTPSTRRSRDS